MATAQQALALDGYAILGAGSMHDQLVQAVGSEFDAQWPAFVDSWHQLEPDPYLAKVGLTRRRRHGVAYLDVSDGVVRFGPHEPHYQSQVYNALQGGIDRWFEPLDDAVKTNLCLQSLLAFCAGLFCAQVPEASRWKIEIHQFRIEALPEKAGEPTPEGTHRDGVDFVAVTLIDRHNILSGTTRVHNLAGDELANFTLTRPLDTVLIDDQRLAHGVTAVSPADPSELAWRDVLVMTFKRADTVDASL